VPDRSNPPTIRPRSATHRRIVRLLERLAPYDGYIETALPDLRLLRANRHLSRAPVMYEPGIVIVCQGRKRGFFGGREFVYDADQYLAVAVPVPFSMETDASEGEPLLALYLRLDLAVATELMLQLDPPTSLAAAAPLGLVASPMDARLQDSVLRLLQALTSPPEARVLGPGIVREIYYRVLSGEQGGSMRAALSAQGPFGKVTRAIRRIHSDFGERLDVDRLAREAGMSVPSFHSHFKAVTHTSPMQYLKSTRLHQARLLMLRGGMTAAAASAQVGYESASQFSREFKRMFGRTPLDEADRMRRAFARPYPGPPSGYVSSH
jgi:AraC-like DNA-binding protein